MSDIEGKAVRVAASECGQRASFNEKGRNREDTNLKVRIKKDEGRSEKDLESMKQKGGSKSETKG